MNEYSPGIKNITMFQDDPTRFWMVLGNSLINSSKEIKTREVKREEDTWQPQQRYTKIN